MTYAGLCQLLTFLGLLVVITKPLGSYMAAIFEGRRTFLSRPLGPVEKLIYHICGVNPRIEQPWMGYAGACLAFGLVNFFLFYAVLRLQGVLPFNPNGFGPVLAPRGSIPLTPDLAFNTAISFMTNTSWQSYAGEATLSYLSQMLGVAVQSFTSAAAGMAVAVALIRGFVRESTGSLGNFWVDVTRGTLYILLPLSFLGALFLCSQGVIQTLRPYPEVTTIEGSTQKIALGTRRFTGAHQAPQLGRGRLLQRQFRSSVRESYAADEFCRDAPYARDPRRPDLHFWANGQGPKARVGPFCRHGGVLCFGELHRHSE